MSNALTARWTAEITVTAWSTHRTALAQEHGYSDGAPAGAADIDQPIAEMSDCPTCHKPMRYFPMKKPGSYMAFAVCLGCNVASEF
jgi:hypothetical protein